MINIVDPQASTVEQSNNAYPEPQMPLSVRLIELRRQAEAEGVPPLTIEEIEQRLGRELGGIAARLLFPMTKL